MSSLLSRIALVAVMAVTLTACTAQERAKRYGGTMTIDLEPCKKLVTATWKDDQFWYLQRPMRASEVAETYEFQEKSKHGLVEGTVIIKEQKGPACTQ